MTLPSISTLYDVIDATWPAANMRAVGPFIVRQGKGGGSRVSATTLAQSNPNPDITVAENAMRTLGQHNLFMIQDGQDPFDGQLADAGYRVMDPVSLYAAPVDLICRQDVPHKTCFGAWPPLASQLEVWDRGGIGPERIAVMDRAKGAKTSILGRANDKPAGTVFAAIHDGCAMLHALEIHPDFRRLGLGRHLTVAVAKWAKAQGANHLALITTNANTGANALYSSLGMSVVGHYHYRIKTEG